MWLATKGFLFMSIFIHSINGDVWDYKKELSKLRNEYCQPLIGRTPGAYFFGNVNEKLVRLGEVAEYGTRSSRTNVVTLSLEERMKVPDTHLMKIDGAIVKMDPKKQPFVCDARTFQYKSIVSGLEKYGALTFDIICRACQIGSLPICMKANPFDTKGWTCYCTYSATHPIDKPALMLST